MLPEAVGILLAGRISHFLVSWQKPDSKPEYYFSGKGLHNTIHEDTFPIKIPDFSGVNLKQTAL